ncbi:hypothetical protein P171DRAFT_477961 [Karstenula rhodostoma CBS 690.94]|uniref:Uncharacterized protein n=1 Tax=Karstenula rhodostoma CBS 690.94 TaxID=1392251 RepID=A0A9P4P3G4_9PLEO|nr:hypothetical protein P171DRAFT_477961 [Karstenula rhodostoma CBS 690.94]
MSPSTPNLVSSPSGEVVRKVKKKTDGFVNHTSPPQTSSMGFEVTENTVLSAETVKMATPNTIINSDVLKIGEDEDADNDYYGDEDIFQVTTMAYVLPIVRKETTRETRRRDDEREHVYPREAEGLRRRIQFQHRSEHGQSPDRGCNYEDAGRLKNSAGPEDIRQDIESCCTIKRCVNPAMVSRLNVTKSMRDVHPIESAIDKTESRLSDISGKGFDTRVSEKYDCPNDILSKYLGNTKIGEVSRLLACHAVVQRYGNSGLVRDRAHGRQRRWDELLT